MCASLFEPISRARDASVDLWDAVFKVGYRGTFDVNWAFAALMAESGGGSIVNLSSLGGMMSSPAHVYGSMKAGLIQLSQNPSAEWRARLGPCELCQPLNHIGG